MNNQYIFSENIIDLIIFLILLMSGFRVYTGHFKKHTVSTIYVVFFGVLIFLFSLYGYIDLDFYNYRSAIDRYYSRHLMSHMEIIYYYIADISGSYMFWRAAIWGSATILMLHTINRLKLSYLSTYLFITIFYAFSFYKLRSSLGTSILFLGLSYILIHSNKEKILSVVIGLILISLSYFFHKSMPVALAIMVLAYFFPFNKMSITISLIAFPFLVILVTTLLTSAVNLNLSFSSEQMNMALDSGTRYIASESGKHNLNGIFRMFLSYMPIYLGLFLLTRDMVFRNKTFPYTVTYLYRYWFLMAYVASLFFFQEVSFWIYIRFLTMSYFPMALVLGYYYYSNKMTVFMKFIIIIGTLSSLMDGFYPIYKRFL